jgi:hypothetical protein
MEPPPELQVLRMTFVGFQEYHGFVGPKNDILIASLLLPMGRRLLTGLAFSSPTLAILSGAILALSLWIWWQSRRRNKPT